MPAFTKHALLDLALLDSTTAASDGTTDLVLLTYSKPASSGPAAYNVYRVAAHASAPAAGGHAARVAPNVVTLTPRRVDAGLLALPPPGAHPPRLLTSAAAAANRSADCLFVLWRSASVGGGSGGAASAAAGVAAVSVSDTDPAKVQWYALVTRSASAAASGMDVGAVYGGGAIHSAQVPGGRGRMAALLTGRGIMTVTSPFKATRRPRAARRRNRGAGGGGAAEQEEAEKALPGSASAEAVQVRDSVEWRRG